MRGMKNVMLFVLFGLLGTYTGFAQNATVTTDNNEPATINQGAKDNSGYLEDDENYHKSLAFKRQVGITQVATGGVFIPSGLTMIAIGTHKMNISDRVASNVEGGEEQSIIDRKAGIIMITTGSVTSLAGALLMMKGCDTLKQIKNRQGDVIGELGLSYSGVGLSMK